MLVIIIATVNSQAHGYGVMKYDDGSMYEGTWSFNKKKKTKKQTYASGPRFVGWWKINKMCGSGSYYYPDGSS